MKYYFTLSSDSTRQMYFRSLSDVFDHYGLNENLIYLKNVSIKSKEADVTVLHHPLEFVLSHFALGAKSLVLYLTNKDYYLCGGPAYNFQRYIVIYEMTDIDQK